MATTPNSETSMSFYRRLVESGKTAIIVPLIIGGAVIVGVIMLWEAHVRKVRVADMARIEEQVRIDMRESYQLLRAHNPDGALDAAARARVKMEALRRRYVSGYSELKTALLLIEGESLFMQDSAGNAAVAERKFDRALRVMTRGSGETWLFAMLGRARTRYELGRLGEAEGDLDKILERNSSFGAAYYWRARIREKLGNTDGALDDARRAKALDSWPPLRDFMQSSREWTRDLFCRPGECDLHYPLEKPPSADIAH